MVQSIFIQIWREWSIKNSDKYRSKKATVFFVYFEESNELLG